MRHLWRSISFIRVSTWQLLVLTSLPIVLGSGRISDEGETNVGLTSTWVSSIKQPPIRSQELQSCGAYVLNESLSFGRCYGPSPMAYHSFNPIDDVLWNTGHDLLPLHDSRQPWCFRIMQACQGRGFSASIKACGLSSNSGFRRPHNWHSYDSGPLTSVQHAGLRLDTSSGGLSFNKDVISSFTGNDIIRVHA